MEHKYYQTYNEHVYHKTLENGLKVYIIPKRDYNKTFVTFTTKYGSFDQSFIPLGKDKRTTQPAGIAHFLEHKLFENEDGTDAFEYLTKLGVQANAFTSFDRTSYLFSGTQNVNEALEYLLDYVQAPYFTKKAVKKEQGIIGEELLMYQDYPSQRMMYGLFKNLYKNHPLNTEIIGTLDSISKITPHKLYEAYNTFYHPSNMVLTVIGNVDENEIIKIVEENQAKKGYEKAEEIKRYYPHEQKSIVKDHTEIEMSVQMPQAGIAVKMPPKDSRYESIKAEFALAVLLNIFLGESSENYQRLLKKGIINHTYQQFPFESVGALTLLITSSTPSPYEFIDEVKKILVNIKRNKISEEALSRQKKIAQGDFISSLNQVEAINNNFVRYQLDGIDLFDIQSIIDSITVDDLIELAKEIKKPLITSLIINPKKV